jgi:uncharacterized membrane protein
MRGPISEAVIIVILGFLIGGIAAAVVHFMIDSKWPPAAAPYAGDRQPRYSPKTLISTTLRYKARLGSRNSTRNNFLSAMLKPAPKDQRCPAD